VCIVGERTNFGFQERRKDMEKQKRKKAKVEKRKLRADGVGESGEGTPP